MKKIVIALILIIILGFVFYQIIALLLGLLIAAGVMFAMLPMGLSIILEYVFYIIGALILFYIVKWVVTDKK